MRRKPRPGGGRQIEVTIEALGARGDGLAKFDGRPVFVAQALPGERMRVRLLGARAGGRRGEILELIEASPARRAPPCPQFGACGGCSLQHLDDDAYVRWKRERVVQALARRGFHAAPVAPLVRIAPGSRRRAVLSAAVGGEGEGTPVVRLGFLHRESHRVADLASCLVLTPGLVALVAPLRAALAPLMVGGERWSLTVSETEAGVDLCLAAGRPPALRDREALAAFAESHDLARLCWRHGGEAAEPIAVRRPPVVTFGRVAVTPPPGGFLQPSRAGEAALAALVLEAVPGDAARIADLYSGCGTFTFRLAERAAVSAFEGDATALAALDAAARRAGLAGRVSAQQRDLARQPLSVEELDPFACVVFDPPRAGAKAQAETIARARVPRVVAVSCEPATFARDARILADGGYRLTSVVPLDQFAWSGHVELVAVFDR